MSDEQTTGRAGATDSPAPPAQESRFSPALLIAGGIALAIALWAIAGGPRLLDGGTLLGALAIGAITVAGVMLIVRPRGREPGPH